MKLMDIAEVAKRSGLPAATLRYYEEKGLIESLGRRGLRRTFDHDVLERLSLIALGQMAGFSLDEIEMMFGSRQRPHVDKALLAAKAEELTRTIRQLGALKNGLDHAASCPAPHHIECPSFQRLMKIAATRIGRSRSRPTRTRRLITSA
ncbi:helix-turn-helix domain-containing protein [Rhizorhapis sp. SPR117]|uniref:helix-turn-helix domain-containing protein n=1 Tax=Rhizorhapis sp. SPR117 TaxID=2912611 RepID=UPI001F280E8C|nr:helix-turn-helix domain-containing protein [Rhizorhapis sp. SPR117]